MPRYTKEEKKILQNFFSSTEKDIFCLINLPEVIKGTLFSRYSRTDKDVRRLFLDDFYLSNEVGAMLQKQNSGKKTTVNLQKAEDFYERILVGYGDDSIAELGGVHIAVENISNVVVKIIQDARIGISPLEKSSRYVFFDQKDDKGRYKYYRDSVLLDSKYGKEYTAFMDRIFVFYTHTVRTLYDYLLKTETKPDGVPDIAFKASCRAKACDVVRYILPMGTQTNTGLYGNGRAFEYLLTKMLAHPLEEVRMTAESMNEELRKVIPAFVKRADNDRGKRYQQYLQASQAELTKLSKKFRENGPKKPLSAKNEIKLLHYDKKALDKVVSSLLFAKSTLSLKELNKEVKDMGQKKKQDIFSSFVKLRENRHNKMPRSLENTTYTFEIISDIGAFRDVHRHRMLSQERQPYTTALGYVIPEEIKKVGLVHEYEEIMTTAHDLFNKINKILPEQAQYVVPFGFRIRYYFTMNLREAVHFTELRSISQGHPSYREIAQKVASSIIKVHPDFKPLFGFVDYKEYALERLEAFNKIAQKAEKLGIQPF